MIFRSGQFRKFHALFALILFPLSGHAEPETGPASPDPAAILAAARMNPMGQNLVLKAQLRTGSDITPFRIFVDDAIHYKFQNPEQELILKLEDGDATLTERIGGESAPIRRARFNDSVRGTGITYEDLALRFLYWPDATYLDEETIRTRRAWKIEIQAHGDSTQYGVARVWIDQESGAILRIEGYNRDGRLIRRFEVISAQKLDGQWMLKQMRVETLNPDTQKVTDRTYLEVLGKAAPASSSDAGE